MNHVSISGRGRVGSKTKAIHGHYSRSRRCWVVTHRDGSMTETGYDKRDVVELGTFRTGKLAAIAAKEYAEKIGATLDGYVNSFLGAK